MGICMNVDTNRTLEKTMTEVAELAAVSVSDQILRFNTLLTEMAGAYEFQNPSISEAEKIVFMDKVNEKYHEE